MCPFILRKPLNNTMWCHFVPPLINTSISVSLTQVSLQCHTAPHQGFQILLQDCEAFRGQMRYIISAPTSWMCPENLQWRAPKGRPDLMTEAPHLASSFFSPFFWRGGGGGLMTIAEGLDRLEKLKALPSSSTPRSPLHGLVRQH